MTALRENALRQRKDITGLVALPVGASKTIYEGGLTVIDIATAYAEAGTNATGKKFRGVAYEGIVNGMTAGEYNVRVYVRGIFRFAYTGSAPEAGARCFLSDDNTVTATAGSTPIFVGQAVEKGAGGYVWVDISSAAGDDADSVFSTTSASATTGALTADQISGRLAAITMSYAGAAALAIPGAASVDAGTTIIVKKTGTAGAITITPAAGTIGGGSTDVTLANLGDVGVWTAVGTDWVRVQDHGVYATTSASSTTAALTAAQVSGKHAFITCSYAGAAALAVPAAATVTPGSTFTLKKTGSAGAITITPAAGTIAGGATHTAVDADGDVATFVALGTDWVLANNVIA